jgi:hypothetical protein
MKFFIILLLLGIALWIFSRAWKNRGDTNGDSGSTGGPDVTGHDHSSSHCDDSSGCDGGGDGGGGD